MPDTEQEEGAVVDRQKERTALIEACIASLPGGNLEHIRPKHLRMLFTISSAPSKTFQTQAHCKLCRPTKPFMVTSSTRYVDHIERCPHASKTLRMACVRMRQVRDQKAVALKHERSEIAEEQQREASEVKRAKELTQGGIRNLLHSSEHIAADNAIAAFFYENAIPFHVAHTEPNSAFRKMVNAIRATSPS